MTMNAEQQYIDLFSQTEAMICKHSAEVLMPLVLLLLPILSESDFRPVRWRSTNIRM